jgi:hypothetical protein
MIFPSNYEVFKSVRIDLIDDLNEKVKSCQNCVHVSSCLSKAHERLECLSADE